MKAYSNGHEQLIRMYGDFGMPIIEIDPAIIPRGGPQLAELLVRAGLAPSPAAAGRFIEAGRVSVDGERAARSSSAVPPALLKCGVTLRLGKAACRRAVIMKRQFDIKKGLGTQTQSPFPFLSVHCLKPHRKAQYCHGIRNADAAVSVDIATLALFLR